MIRKLVPLVVVLFAGQLNAMNIDFADGQTLRQRVEAAGFSELVANFGFVLGERHKLGRVKPITVQRFPGMVTKWANEINKIDPAQAEELGTRKSEFAQLVLQESPNQQAEVLQLLGNTSNN